MKYVFWNVGSFLGPFFLALETVYLGSQGKAGGDVDGLTIAQVVNLHLNLQCAFKKLQSLAAFKRLRFMRLMNFHRGPFSVTGWCCHGGIAETRKLPGFLQNRPNRVPLRSDDGETHCWTKAHIAYGLWRNMDTEHQLDGRSERDERERDFWRTFLGHCHHFLGCSAHLSPNVSPKFWCSPNAA